MHAKLNRIAVILVCLLFGVGTSRLAQADTSKKWPAKKHHKHHKSAKPAAGASAPAEEAEGADDKDDKADDSADDKQADAPVKSSKTKKGKASEEESADDEREASDDKGGGDDEGEGTVVRRKAHKPVAVEEDTGAPVGLELMAGPRALHRTFDFNDPLSDHVAGVSKPYSYVLPAGPAPFVDVGLYPLAFTSRGFPANLGLVAHYERLVSTKTEAADGSSFSTLGQEFEIGARARMPFGEHEAGLGISYGKQTFHVAANDPGPGAGSTVPNVDYSFVAVGADGRVRLAPIEIDAHLGTRLVYNTGSLAKNWFNTTKTTAIEAGVAVSYRITPMFSVVAGGDIVRYAFDFNPVLKTNALIAGGAVDQYLSGFLALRVSLSGG